MVNPKANHDDPRDSSLETKLGFPKTWCRESNELLNSSALFLSGIIIVTRNRYLSWPALIIGINALINQHPLRSKDGGSGWSSIGFSLVSLIVSYMPLFLVVNAAPSF